MNRVAKRARYLSILIVFFLFCAAVFINDYRSSASLWVVHPSNTNIYHDGILTIAGDVYSSDGIKLLQSDANGVSYADDVYIRESTLHVVGDLNNNITTGVLASQKDSLIGYSLLNGVYHVSSSNTTLNLTINAEISSLAYQALGDFNGAVGIYNYETGEIISMVSNPSYDPLAIPDLTQEDYEGVFINRVMNGLYVPGSIMKLVTSYAAIETIDDIYEQTFHCEHGIEVEGEWIQCTGYHGDQTFEEALANSCNAAYATIALQLGNDTLASYAKKAGVTTSYTIDGVHSSAGIFNINDAALVNLAWAGIGQYTTMINPMQYMMFMGAIANDGIQVTPHYIDSDSFLSSINLTGSTEKRLLSTDTARQLQSLMRNNTISSYGDENFPDLDLCAKTGTAEVEDGAPHSWFVGFSKNSSLPLAFVVIVENGSGSLLAQNVAKKVLNETKEILSK